MHFQRLDITALEKTLDKWREQASKYEFFPEDVDRKLAWARDALNLKVHPDAHQVIPYGVFENDGDDAAIAVCELVLSNRGAKVGKWLKMLRITLSPEIEIQAEEKDPHAIRSAISVYRTATVGSFSERLNHSADTLKVYGRNQEQLELLIALLSTIEEAPSLEATREGRWLILRSANLIEPVL